MFNTSFLEIDKLDAYANKAEDHCSIDRIEWDKNDRTSFRVHVKDIERKYISEKVSYRFHLVYTTLDSKVYEQTVDYNGESWVHPPRELLRDDGSIRTSF